MRETGAAGGEREVNQSPSVTHPHSPATWIPVFGSPSLSPLPQKHIPTHYNLLLLLPPPLSSRPVPPTLNFVFCSR